MSTPRYTWDEKQFPDVTRSDFECVQDSHHWQWIVLFPLTGYWVRVRKSLTWREFQHSGNPDEWWNFIDMRAQDRKGR